MLPFKQSLNVPGKLIDRIRTIVQSTAYLLPSANAPQVNDCHAMAEELHRWDTEVSCIIRSLTSSGPYGDPEEAYRRTLCFDGGSIYEPASPVISEALKAWRQAIQLAHQSYHSLRFSSMLSSCRTAFLIFLNVSFLSYGVLLLSARNISLYGVFWWLLSWAIAQWSLCAIVDRTALALDPNVIIDIGKFKLQRYKLVERCGPFEQLFGKFTAGRRFCITERGYMGWVSLAAQEGDEIASLAGTNILFTLRRGETGFYLMGDCYLQDLMEGEAYTLEGLKEVYIRII